MSLICGISSFHTLVSTLKAADALFGSVLES
jgi:hypothetical protein